MKQSDFKKLITEKEHQKRCFELLEIAGIVAWRCNSGVSSYEYTYKTGIRKGTKTRNVVAFGFPGMPDIAGYIPTNPENVLSVAVPFYWEVKRYGKKPTKEQMNFISKAVMDGCVAWWGTSDDLEKFLKEHNFIK